MSGLQVFNYSQNEIRMVMQEDGPWWVLADVCKVLGLSNPSKVAGRLDDDEKMTLTLSEVHSGQRGGPRRLLSSTKAASTPSFFVQTNRRPKPSNAGLPTKCCPASAVQAAIRPRSARRSFCSGWPRRTWCRSSGSAPWSSELMRSPCLPPKQVNFPGLHLRKCPQMKKVLWIAWRLPESSNVVITMC